MLWNGGCCQVPLAKQMQSVRSGRLGRCSAASPIRDSWPNNCVISVWQLFYHVIEKGLVHLEYNKKLLRPLDIHERTLKSIDMRSSWPWHPIVKNKENQTIINQNQGTCTTAKTDLLIFSPLCSNQPAKDPTSTAEPSFYSSPFRFSKKKNLHDQS